MSCEYYRETREALQLNGLSAKTQAAYLRAVRMLCDFHACQPDQLTEAQLRRYYLHRRNVDHWAPSTLRISFCGVRFFFTHVLLREWPTLNLLDAKREHHLPAVLSLAEVRALLAAVRLPRYRAFLITTYSCGLRLQEALHLKVSDIDAARGLIHVLPSGSMKIRYYGFLAPTSKLTLEQVHLRIQLASAFELIPPPSKIAIAPAPLCRHCGGTLRFVRLIRPRTQHTGPPHAVAA